MRLSRHNAINFGLAFIALTRLSAGDSNAITPNSPGVLWREPADIRTRNLFYGPGGEKDAPKGPFTFEKEDLDGTNPKFVVRDPAGAKWKVKLGEEVRPETAASRLVWAAGYFADEDYFMPEIHVDGLPAHLHRGQSHVEAGGMFRDVRLKRYLKGQEKVGKWSWKDDPFTGTRELNGLRIMMALINNWDLKDENNTVYERALSGGISEHVYLVSDLGASFGTPGRSVTRAESKGNLRAYEHSKFIHDARNGHVDFNVPARPAMIHIFEFPEYIRRIHLRSIGRNIPVADCQWLGHILSGLTREQIESAFIAAGYPAVEASAFAVVVEERIAQLSQL